MRHKKVNKCCTQANNMIRKANEHWYIGRLPNNRLDPETDYITCKIFQNPYKVEKPEKRKYSAHSRHFSDCIQNLCITTTSYA